ncbi:MAG: hypothetical protein EBS54_03050 [Betaproteobacteria bacterium]|nr:hypothetical protein [Betaproteobacteria bacterium]NBT05760.1 hypothetical protein [Betaproteobacteria bacterium]
MRTIFRLFIMMVAAALAGCFETLPRLPSIDDLPASPTLKDRNAAVAQAWDKASLDCRAQHKPKGSFCEQLKTEGEFLSCSAERFAKAAQSLRYPSPDKIWVWHNCVKTTANLLQDGLYLTRPDIDKRMTACQSKLDPEPEFPVRQSGWFAPLIAFVSASDREPVQAVMPGDFGVNQSQVALPSCAARFAPQVQAAPEGKPIAIVAPVSPSAPVVQAPVVQAPADAAEPVNPTKQMTKPRARNAVATSEVKSTSSLNPVRPGSSASASSASPEMKGACPIPGACGPTVPPDAVKRP